MPAKEPSWWYDAAPRWQSTVLKPLAYIYGAISVRRFNSTTSFRSKFPVICVGNFTAGGTGKTPMSILVAELVEGLGYEPWFLSRGYGGRLDGQERVDIARHSAAEVGDEPLLLAKRAPTVISRDRRLGAEFIARQAPVNAVIIMDDGLQNPSLFKDLSIAVVDGKRGLGNGAVIPAGPLRAPMPFQVRLTDVIVINGENGNAAAQMAPYLSTRKVPLLSAQTQAQGETSWLNAERIVAYVGIANPGRFFDLLYRLGASVVERIVFADHHTLTNAEAEDLIALADKNVAQLITTEKDFARLSGLRDAREILKKRSKTLPITLHMSAEHIAKLNEKIAATINARRNV